MFSSYVEIHKQITTNIQASFSCLFVSFTGSSRNAILAVAAFFMVGGGVLTLVDVEEGRRVADAEEEHLPVALLSFPDGVDDRTRYLLEHQGENPAAALAGLVRELEGLGAVVAGIACNTAHATAIYTDLTERLDEDGCRVRLLHMIEETAAFLRASLPQVRRVGVLSTNGTARLGVYGDALAPDGLEVVLPAGDVQEEVHRLQLAHDGEEAVVFAQLQAGGDWHGVHALLVPIRDDDGTVTGVAGITTDHTERVERQRRDPSRMRGVAHHPPQPAGRLGARLAGRAPGQLGAQGPRRSLTQACRKSPPALR